MNMPMNRDEQTRAVEVAIREICLARGEPPLAYVKAWLMLKFSFAGKV
ncbi:MAG: hypothetical protein JWR07_1924 [Nevskia sp.]|nr:hypothetical protein [Nevskia sp.]